MLLLLEFVLIQMMLKISNRFQIKLVESSEHNGPHTTEIISYMVVESGSGELPDGTYSQQVKPP